MPGVKDKRMAQQQENRGNEKIREGRTWNEEGWKRGRKKGIQRKLEK